ncbi:MULTISPECIES: NADP-dependent isocitrate dehydrogenase [unclassified Pseudoalteromonas]|uniref:NADP-dependent isocitrate dehydrogenase n=1 Tax=unclassified Pseudoalteromonas TaxID=194690 RepID=UPI0011093864|nr:MULTISPECIES: NADP-dependent isocitrate dehydrogenase [unclassified Pseudoalteromonas]TMN82707.1 NADP-dependent isocitrate dehydrogenase [Pseudoalteromonas sp. S410]TMN92716.1 NADP-dependent isocitrate dehydrogenase [Pseudoalteromonas sp. S408]TMN97492.1 NADP-dependent isocitrate dehydrogenase [Pseudoalteromonas sp. S409]TMO01041.1 NADP-dependent isocitrate dehydrogenase [Pseudoalteromonas sp. S407]TMO11239.1 NADP-dependent isocitrate dehydrogenase [Pseudoalteromonas sp. S186]|tara:strand:+ start:348 stop:1616 length:1269 start_codon:yes stop_codon:yes gene_type:complete
MQYQHINMPKHGQHITVDEQGQWVIPSEPIIAYINGDGVGQDVMPVMRNIVDCAITHCYQNKRKIHWMQVFNGEQAAKLYDGDWFPQETIQAVRACKIAIKGPLTTPLGGGFRSLNVALRQEMDLFVNMRTIKGMSALPSPLKNPFSTNITVLRDSSEDVYSGIEWQAGSIESEKMLDFLCEEMGVTRLRFSQDCGIGIKNISKEGSERLTRFALNFALNNNRDSLTFVHKGNVLKFTDGAFKRWGFALAKKEFNAIEHENGRWLKIVRDSQAPLIIKEVIADNMLQQCLMNPEQFDVVATTNQNGDFLADMLSAQVGGVGIMPAANMNNDVAFFEPTHGTFERIAGQNKANPSSSILSAVLMLKFMKWDEAALTIENALEKTLASGHVTFDLAQQGSDTSTIHNSTTLSCTDFANKVIEHF